MIVARWVAEMYGESSLSKSVRSRLLEDENPATLTLLPLLGPSTVPGKHGVGVGDEAGFDSHVGAQRGLKG